MEIRPIEPRECEALGAVSDSAYGALPGAVHEPAYAAALRDVAARAATDLVLVAVDDDGTVLGGVTYVADASSPNAEFDGDDEAGFRMLAVSVGAQGRGVGDALVRACIDHARAGGRRRLVIHTTPWMPAARRLYERLGFRRAPELDWRPVPDVPLLGYVLDLAVGWAPGPGGETR